MRGRISILLLWLSSTLSQEVDQGRLPYNAIPNNYDIDIIIVLEEGDVAFEGTFSVDIDVTVDTSYDGTITFHADGLTIDEDSVLLVNGDTLTPYTILGIEYDSGWNLVTVSYGLDEPFSDHRVTLSGNYSGSGDSYGFGMFEDHYTDFTTKDTRYLVGTMFAPNGASMVFPCMDEPDRKATFNFRIGRHTSYNSVFNTPMISQGEDPVEGYPDYVWDVYETTPIISTYLISLGINDFAYEESSSTTSNGVRHRSYARKDYVDAGYTSYAVNEFVPQLLEYYEETFGSAYPISKLDQISYPRYAGAMENWGLIVYGEDLLVWDGVISGADEREAVARVVAHENGHNLFGNSVTCQWWDAIWLNEGFAEYVQFLGLDAVEPGFDFWDSFYHYEFQYVLKFDGTTRSHPTIREVPAASDVDFGPITYDRGSALNRYLSSVLTRDSFIRGLNTYLADNAYNNTQFDDLWTPLNEIGHSEGTLDSQYEIKDIMESFMVQMNYPLLNIMYDPISGIANLTQQRFLYDPENADPNDDYRWFVPISYTFVGDESTDFGNSGPPGTFEGPAHNTLFMRPEETTLELDIGPNDLPVVFNLQSSAFMRVNYDNDNWDKLINQLRSDHLIIDQVNRAALINDAFALAEAGIQDYDLALDVAQYLIEENSYNVMGVAFDILQDLIDSSSSDISAMALEDFLESIISSKYGLIGIEEDLTNSHHENQFQRIIVSATDYLELPQLDNDAGDVFDVWMQAEDPDDPEQNPVNRHVKRHVYCAGARELGSTAVDFMQERLQNALLPQEIDSLEYGISCEPGRSMPEVVSSLLDPILAASEIPMRSAPLRLFNLAIDRSPVATLGWLDLNYEDLTKETHISNINKMLVAITETLYRKGNSLDIITKLNDFKDKHDLNRRSLQFVDWAIYGTELNLKRDAKYGGDIIQWVSHKLGKTY